MWAEARISTEFYCCLSPKIFIVKAGIKILKTLKNLSLHT